MPTFLFTDIEGSTSRWECARDAMSSALCLHDTILRDSAALHGGRMLKHTGDGIIAVFDNGRALECALHAQAALQAADWSDVGGLAVRMCVFAGDAEEREGDYFGPALNGAARMLSAAWGGQVLANAPAAAAESLPEGAALADAGVHVLRDLLEPQQILVLTHPSLRSEFPALRTVSSRPQNLPVQPTPFHGRARELDEVCGLLGDPACRLLTILAPGGTGKSRLALQSAARVITGFRHGAFFVRLEEVPSAALIPAAVASAMGFRFSGPSPEEDQLAAFLADRETLVIADNFEHLSRESPILSRLLARSPGLKLLVTSRHRLDLREERVYELHGMALPEPGGSDLESSDASALFLSTADRAMPGWRPGRSDRPAVAAICTILDGSPLGIELASSWVRMVPPADIAAEIGRSFELLDSAPLDMPGRHRGLEAVFEYSWSLLDDREREALSGLSVFSGSFDPAAAAAVAGCGLPVLRRLVDKSLLQCPSPGSFGMHPIVHAYAAGKLSRQPGRPEELRERHAHHYAARMREESPRIHQPDSAEALRRIEEALPNLLMAWDHSAESWPAGDGRIFLVVLSALFIARSTLSIARRVFSEKIGTYTRRWGADPSPDQASLLSNLLERIATFQNLAGLLDETRPVLRQALELAEKADDPELLPRLLGTLGVLEAQTNNTDEARKCFLRMLEKFEEIGDRSQMCVALSNLATLEFLEGNYEEAFGFYGRSLEISREQGDLINQMRALGSLGFMLIRAGDCERAQACLGESLGIARSLGDRRSEELALLGLADILKDADPSRAEELAGECIDLAESIEHVSMQVHAHLVLAGILIRLGRRTEARAALDTATALSGGDFDSQSEMRVEELERMLSDAGT